MNRLAVLSRCAAMAVVIVFVALNFWPRTEVEVRGTSLGSLQPLLFDFRIARVTTHYGWPLSCVSQYRDCEVEEDGAVGNAMTVDLPKGLEALALKPMLVNAAVGAVILVVCVATFAPTRRQ